MPVIAATNSDNPFSQIKKNTVQRQIQIEETTARWRSKICPSQGFSVEDGVLGADWEKSHKPSGHHSCYARWCREAEWWTAK